MEKLQVFSALFAFSVNPLWLVAVVSSVCACMRRDKCTRCNHFNYAIAQTHNSIAVALRILSFYLYHNGLSLVFTVRSAPTLKIRERSTTAINLTLNDLLCACNFDKLMFSVLLCAFFAHSTHENESGMITVRKLTVFWNRDTDNGNFKFRPFSIEKFNCISHSHAESLMKSAHLQLMMQPIHRRCVRNTIEKKNSYQAVVIKMWMIAKLAHQQETFSYHSLPLTLFIWSSKRQKSIRKPIQHQHKRK